MGNSFMSKANKQDKNTQDKNTQDKNTQDKNTQDKNTQDKDTDRIIVTLPRHSQRKIERLHSLSSPSKYLSCILCNKTLDISNTDHQCEIRPFTEEFSIKFTF